MYEYRGIALEDLKNIVYAVFTNAGRDTISRQEFMNILAYNLQWFKPSEAGKIVDICEASGLVINDKGMLKPCFDIRDMKIPLGYRPPREVLHIKIAMEDVFMKIVNAICAATNMNTREVIAEINALHDRTMQCLDVKVIALIIARRHGVDILSYIDDVENVL